MNKIVKEEALGKMAELQKEYIDNKVNTTKIEIINGASELFDTFKEVEDFIIQEGEAIDDINSKLYKEVDTNGYEYVDMGEAGIWAKYPIGVTEWSSESVDNIKYFEWGGIEGYTKLQVGIDKQFNDDFSNYRFSGDGATSANPQFTKYCYDSKYGENGFSDNLTALELEDDAARVNMGGDWRLPTREELTKLIDNCNAEGVENYEKHGINGILFTLRSDSSKQLFLPAGGWVDSNNVGGFSYYGHFWTSTLNADSYAPNPITSYVIRFNADGGIIKGFRSNRSNGLPIIGFIPSLAKEERYLPKDEAAETYQPKGDYATKNELNAIAEEKANKEEVANLNVNATDMLDTEPLFISERTDVFPEIITNNRVYYVNDGEKFIMYNGKVVDTNMDLIVSPNKVNSTYLNEITSEDSSIHVYEINGQPSNLKVLLDTDNNQYTNLTICGLEEIPNASLSTFANQTSLEYVDLKFYKQYDITNLLSECKSVKTVVLPNKFTNGNYFARNCTALETVLNTPEELTEGEYEYMFSGCSNLKYLDKIIKINGASVVRVMFEGCVKLGYFPVHSDIVTSDKAMSMFVNLAKETDPIEEANFNLTCFESCEQFLSHANVRKIKIKININGGYNEGKWNAYNPGLICMPPTEELDVTFPDEINWNTTYLFESTVWNKKDLALKKATLRNVKGMVKGEKGFSAGFTSYLTNLKYLYLDYFGKTADNVMDFRYVKYWGCDGEENRQSVLDTLLRNSEDLKALGQTQTVQLSNYTMAVLTENEIKSITNKGYNLITYTYND